MKPVLSTPLKYGLIGSLLTIGVLVVLFFTGKHPLLIPIFFDARILIFGLFIFFGIKEFKDIHNNGILQFWQGMIIGIGIYVIIGLVTGLFIVIFSNIESSFFTEYIDGTVAGLELEKDQLVNQGKITISEEEFQHQVNLLKESSPFVLGFDYFFKSCLLGFFITILLAVILRKSEKRFTK